MKSIIRIISITSLMFASYSAIAQTPVAAMYGAGVSYSNNASPSIAGTALYAHSVNDSGTYAFTSFDVLPNTLKPFTVTSNVGAGIAQRIFTIKNIPVYAPAGTGVSWSGSNLGWMYNAGFLASIHIKNDYYIMPTLRFNKSSVSNGTGYQPIIGVLFGWGR